MDEGDYTPPVNMAALPYGKAPRCIFCGMGVSAQFGQGDLRRFRTTRVSLGIPDWYDLGNNPSDPSKAKRASSRGSRSTPVMEVLVVSTPNLSINPVDHMVGNHCSLDACRRLQEGKIMEHDGKPTLSGLPNAFVDSEGRPFGFVDELSQIGWPAPNELGNKLVLENLLVACAPREGGEGSWLYAHHCCASWSDGVVMNDQMAFEHVEEAAVRAIETQCALCQRMGASLTCHADGCTRSFHFPCAAGAGCYQEIQKLTIFCPSHLDQVSSLGDDATPCFICDQINDVAEMIFCITCGSHFHNPCLEPPLILSTTVRVGWQCPECKMCLFCSESKDETKMLVCDVCDKGFHTYCLKPPVASIPKNGFKCDRCRICTDCGLRRFNYNKSTGTPINDSSDNQPSIRWHSNYTLCDRCYHGRKRQSACCAVCERAWRCSINSNSVSSSTICTWLSRKCQQCRRMVHFDCDPVAQAAASPNSSSPSASSEDAGLSQTISYACPACRAHDSATLSEGASATASLRTSPNAGGGSSCCGDTGDDGSLSVGGVATSTVGEGSPWIPSGTPTVQPFDEQLTTNNIYSNSTTPTTEPGKQTNSTGVPEQPQPPTLQLKGSPHLQVGGKGARSHHKLTRGPLTKSKSVSGSSGDALTSWPGRKRNHVAGGENNNVGLKNLAKLSQNSASMISLPTHPTMTKTVGAKRAINAVTSTGGTRARRSKNRKAQVLPKSSAIAVSKVKSTLSVIRYAESYRHQQQKKATEQQRIPTLMIHKLALPNSSMFFVPFGGLDKYESQPIGNGAAKKSLAHLSRLYSLKKRPERKRLFSYHRRQNGDNGLEPSSKIRIVRYVTEKHCWAMKCDSKANQEKDDHPSTVVICRADDRFVLEQDMCLACGSFGDPNSLIACAQCGQCFHAYCTDVGHVSRTMLKKGWRCLECTICEGCGQTTDENLLLLCDECDISYHTFCLKPPLKEVPKVGHHLVDRTSTNSRCSKNHTAALVMAHNKVGLPLYSGAGNRRGRRLEGGWKCANCVSCLHCGNRSPGVNGEWHGNYTQCSPCASQVTCPVCTLSYRDGELLIKCAVCARWSHAGCDQLHTEDELDFVSDMGYNCILCRELGATRGPGHQQLLAFRAANGHNAPLPSSWKYGEGVDNLFADKLPSCSSMLGFGSAGSSAARSDEEQGSPIEIRQFFLDGVVLSENGLSTIRQAMLKSQPKRPAIPRRTSIPSSTNADATTALDTAPPSVFTPADEEASQQSAIDADSELASAMYPETKSPSVISEEDGTHSFANSESNSTSEQIISAPVSCSGLGKSTKTNAKSASARRLLNLGVGGFRARPSRVYQTKKTQMAVAAAVAAGTPLSKVPQPMDKKRRQAKKKSDLEENYPDYLMQAFYGVSLLTADRQNNNTQKRRRKMMLQQQQLLARNRSISQSSTPYPQAAVNTSADPSEASSVCDFKSSDPWSITLGGRSGQSSKMPSPRSEFTSPNHHVRQNSWPGGGTLDSPFPSTDDFDIDVEDMDEDFNDNGDPDEPFDSAGLYKPENDLIREVSLGSSNEGSVLLTAVVEADQARKHALQTIPELEDRQRHNQQEALSSAEVQLQIPATQSTNDTTSTQMNSSLDDYMLVNDLLDIEGLGGSSQTISNVNVASTSSTESLVATHLDEQPIVVPTSVRSTSVLQNIVAGSAHRTPHLSTDSINLGCKLSTLPCNEMQVAKQETMWNSAEKFAQISRNQPQSAKLSDVRYTNQSSNNQLQQQRSLYSDEQMSNRMDEVNNARQSRRFSDSSQSLSTALQQQQSQTQSSHSNVQMQQSAPNNLNLLPELSVMDIESQLFEFETDAPRSIGGALSVNESTPPMMSGDLVSPKMATSSTGGGGTFASYPQTHNQQESSAAGFLSVSPSVQQQQAKAVNSPHDMIPRTQLHPGVVIKSGVDLVGPQDSGSPKPQIVQQRDSSFVSSPMNPASQQTGQISYAQDQGNRSLNPQSVYVQQQVQQRSIPLTPQPHQLQQPMSLQRQFSQPQGIVQQQQMHQQLTQGNQTFYVGQSSQQQQQSQYVPISGDDAPPPPPYPHSRPVRWHQQNPQQQVQQQQQQQQYRSMQPSSGIANPMQRAMLPGGQKHMMPDSGTSMQYIQQQQRLRTQQAKEAEKVAQRIPISPSAFQQQQVVAQRSMTPIQVGGLSPKSRQLQQFGQFPYEVSVGEPDMRGGMVGQPMRLGEPGSGFASNQDRVTNQQLKTMLRQDVSPRRPVDISGLSPGGGVGSGLGVTPPSASMAPGTSSSRRINLVKWEEDERLGDHSTIAPILHANMIHPELREQYADFRARAREINKLWRRLSSDERGGYVNQARTNRAQLKASQSTSPRGGGGVNTSHIVGGVTAGSTPFLNTSPGSVGLSGMPLGRMMEQPGRNTPISSNFNQSPLPIRHAQSFQDRMMSQPSTSFTPIKDVGVIPASPRILELPGGSVIQRSADQRDMDPHSASMTPSSHLSDGSSIPIEVNQSFHQQISSQTSHIYQQQQQQQSDTNQEEIQLSNRGSMSSNEPTIFQQSFSPFSRPPSSSSLDVVPPPPQQQALDPNNMDSRTVMSGYGGPPSVAASQPSPALSPAGGFSRQPQTPSHALSMPLTPRGGPTSLPPHCPTEPQSPMSQLVSSPSVCAPSQFQQQHSLEQNLNNHVYGQPSQHLPPPPPPPTWPPSGYVSSKPNEVFVSGPSPSPVGRSPATFFQPPSTPGSVGAHSPVPLPPSSSTPSPSIMMQQGQHHPLQQHIVQSPHLVPSPGRPSICQQITCMSGSQMPSYANTPPQQQSSRLMHQQQHINSSSILSTINAERKKLRDVLAEKVYQRQVAHMSGQMSNYSPAQTTQSQQQVFHQQQSFQYQYHQQQQQQSVGILAPNVRTSQHPFFSSSGSPNQHTYFRGSPAPVVTAIEQQQYTSAPVVRPQLSSTNTVRSPSRSSSVQSPSMQSNASPPVAPPVSPLVSTSLLSPPVLLSSTGTQFRSTVSEPPQQQHQMEMMQQDNGGYIDQHQPTPRRSVDVSASIQQPQSPFCVPPGTPYQTSSGMDMHMQNVVRSPHMSQQPQLSIKPDTNMTPNSGIEDTGFEPPVIFSRVIGKERRFVPPQTQDILHDPSSITTQPTDVYAAPINRMDDTVIRINPVSQPRFTYESDFCFPSENDCSSHDQMMQHYVPASRQSPINSPQTPSRMMQQPPTTHLDDVIAHVVSDAVAYANDPPSVRPVYNESPAQYLISESNNKPGRVPNYVQEAPAGQQPYGFNNYSMSPQQQLMETAISHQQLRQMPLANNHNTLQTSVDFPPPSPMYEQQGVRFRPISAEMSDIPVQSPHPAYIAAQTPYYVPPSPFISSAGSDGVGQMAQGHMPSMQRFEEKLHPGNL